MNCINLMERFGRRYRIAFDPAYDPKGRPRDKLDPWMMVIGCRYGEIYPAGGEFLRVDINGHNRLAMRIEAISGCELVQDGDFEKTFRFTVDQFAAVARIVQPWRRPQFSAEHRERMRCQAQRINSQKPRKSTVPAPQTHDRVAT